MSTNADSPLDETTESSHKKTTKKAKTTKAKSSNKSKVDKTLEGGDKPKKNKKNKDKSASRIKLSYVFLVIGVLLLLYLQYLLWFGHGGHYEHKKLMTVVEAQEKKNADLTERNRVLAAEVNDLKNGNIAVEEHARVDLGLIKPGETFIQLNSAE